VEKSDCPECDGRGWVKDFPGDTHGSICPKCHGGPEVEGFLTGPTGKRSLRKGKSGKEG
jgi:DnaJ-class molecular chaperone